MYFVFENPGVIDPRSITTFGVSSKDDSSKAIGFFGTGLKYAIAIILRLGGGIAIYSGGKKYVFGVFRETIRNDEFQLVTMNNVKLGFTTELGKTWEMWQAFRELHCNCADESGTSFESQDGNWGHGENVTRVVVQGAAFEDVWRKRGEIILSTTPVLKGGAVDIHPGSTSYVYYRGIRAGKLNKPARFTYNIHEKLELTEDRTIKYDFYVGSRVAMMYGMSTDPKLITECISEREDGFWEGSLSFSTTNLSPEFEAAAVALAKSMRFINRTVFHRLHEMAFERVVSDDTDKMSKIDQLRLAKAVSFLKKIGWDVTAYPIIVSENIGEHVLGRAHEGKIYIAHRTFMMGTKMLAGTLLEEYIHLKHGHMDCDRPMQNYLFDALMSMGELITGEVL